MLLSGAGAGAGAGAGSKLDRLNNTAGMSQWMEVFLHHSTLQTDCRKIY